MRARRAKAHILPTPALQSKALPEREPRALSRVRRMARCQSKSMDMPNARAAAGRFRISNEHALARVRASKPPHRLADTGAPPLRAIRHFARKMRLSGLTGRAFAHTLYEGLRAALGRTRGPMQYELKRGNTYGSHDYCYRRRA